jgi:PAS domain S-box-containing protein
MEDLPGNADTSEIPLTADPGASSEVATIAIGVEKRRNRELLTELLSAYETVEAEAELDRTTDLCIVDPGGFSRLGESIERWKRESQPAAAPVFLLANADESDLWAEYGDVMGRRLDAVQSIPAPKRAILVRVRGLLETRRYSLAATRRQEQLELYERAMDGANVGITIADASGSDRRLVYANEGFEAVTGYSPKDAVGRNCRFLQGPRTEAETVDRIRDALDAEAPISVEILNYRRNGEPFWNDLDIVPVRDDSGAVTHFLGFQQDVTERKQREARLARYEQVIRSLDDPIVVVDAKRCVELSNAAAVEVFGTDGTLVDSARATSLFPPEARSEVRKAFTAVERTGEPQERQFTLPSSDGRKRVYQFRFQRERSTADRPVARTIVIGRDVTTLREYQSRLSVLDRVLRHNLRNKLNVIMGHTDRLTAHDAELSPETVADVAENVDASVAELLDIADAARKFHQSIVPGEQAGTATEIDTLLADVTSASRERFPEADIRSRVPADVLAIAPRTIRDGIEQLVENSVVYADSPEPRVRLTASIDPESNTVEIRITDDGPGIPKREREALNRGAETSLQHLQGVSLWLVNWAVKSVDGEFEILENRPTGTIVVIRLPCVER